MATGGDSGGAVEDVRPDLQVTAKNVPIDDDFLSALPPEKREWVKKAGISGRLDASGRIFFAQT